MRVQIHDEVRRALHEARPVVALETAVLTHGLPRTPLDAALRPDDDAWHANGASNIETMRAMARAVRDTGAIPAPIAVLGGQLTIGADDDALAALAVDTTAHKASVGNLAWIMAHGANAGTTVSATLTACRRAPAGPIRVFATGGIGGVHPGFSERPDVSADLPELGRTATCVVCSGAKSILDGPATLEVLETLGVPVIGYGTSHLPRFHVPGTNALTLGQRVDTPDAAATVCRMQWHDLDTPRGLVLTVPVPGASALDPDELDDALQRAARDLDARGTTGPARTPALLASLTDLTGGRSLRANIALLINNARVAGSISVALAGETPVPEQP